MNKVFTLGFVVKTAGIAAVAGIVGGALLIHSTQADDEDRPQIIVRGGSVTIDDGDASLTKPWKKGGSKKDWRPDQAKGAPVRYFAVMVQNAGTTGSPSAPCPAVGMIATSVAIEYRKTVGDQTEVNQIQVGLAPTGKAEPLITSTVDLEPQAANAAELVYNPNGGGISKVTIAGMPGSTSNQACFFDAGSAVKPVITIQPLK